MNKYIFSVRFLFTFIAVSLMFCSCKDKDYRGEQIPAFYAYGIFDLRGSSADSAKFVDYVKSKRYVYYNMIDIISGNNYEECDDYAIRCFKNYISNFSYKEIDALNLGDDFYAEYALKGRITNTEIINEYIRNNYTTPDSLWRAVIKDETIPTMCSWVYPKSED